MASFMTLAGFGSKKKKRTEIEVAVVEVDLFEPTADKYPRFHLPTLIKEQTGKSFDEDDNPLEDNEDYRKLESLASKFEEKYGPKRDKKGRKIKFGKPEDYMDLGMGYDADDPFIDDTEAYDELVPSTLTPIHGGFYVNKGQLEFREVSDSDDDDESNEPPKKKPSRLAPVITPTSSESSSESDEESSLEKMDDLEDSIGNKSGTSSPSKLATPPSAGRNKGQILKVGRLSMTPKQKASANLLKNSKGWIKKTKGQNEPRRVSQLAEKSDSFYGRVNDVVNSVVDSVRQVQVAKAVESVVTANALRIESVVSAVSKPTSDNGGTKQKVTESASSTASTAGHPTGLEKVDNGSGQKTPTAKKTPVPESKDPKPTKPNGSPRSSPEVTVVKELPAPQSTPRLTGKPPTAAPKTAEAKEKWPVPVHLQKLNDLLVERAKEGGQLCFSGRTDFVLRKIMTECASLGYNEEKLQAVLGDLSTKLRVHRNKIIARWEKVKDFRPDQSGKKPIPGSSTSNSSATTTSSASSTSTPSASTPTPVKKPAESSSESLVSSLVKKPIEPISTSTSPLAAKYPPIIKASEPQSTSAKKPNETSIATTNISTLLELMQQEINRQMPSLEAEHRKLAEDVALKKLEQIQNPGFDGERMKNVYTPRRKYAWNEHSKKILDAIVSKVMKHLISDQSFVDKEEALRTYMEQQVVPLWPSGWMNARELLKESRSVYSRTTPKTDDDIPHVQTSKPTDSVSPHVSTVTTAQTVTKVVTPASSQSTVTKIVTPPAPIATSSPLSTFRIPTASASTTPVSAPGTSKAAYQPQTASLTKMASQATSISIPPKAPPQASSNSVSPKMTASEARSYLNSFAKASQGQHGVPVSRASKISSHGHQTSHSSPTSATQPTSHVQTGPQALAASAVKLGSHTQISSQAKARMSIASISSGSSSTSTPPMTSSQRLGGFSIHNLTSSPMATVANAMNSVVTSVPSIARTWSTSTAAMDEAQKQRAQMELALIMAAAGQQAHPNSHPHPNASNPWYSRQH